MDFVRPSRPVGVSLIAGRGHYETVIQAVLGAELSVWIATANLKEAVELFLECADPAEINRRLHTQVFVTRFEAAHG